MVGLCSFGLGWWTNEMKRFADGVKQDIVRTDSLRKNVDIGTLTLQKTPFTPDTLLDDNIDLIIRQENGTIDIWRKFRPSKKFTDYPVTEFYSGVIPDNLDFSKFRYGKKFITVTTDFAKKGTSFAGHYAFARWGCGSNCQMSAVVDLKTGIVYDGPDATHGYEYNSSSRLLIVNPPDSSGLYYPCSYCIPELYLWTGSKFKRIE